MPKPNYASAKRQREVAKKQKKEAKLRERAAGKAAATESLPNELVPAKTETLGGG